MKTIELIEKATKINEELVAKLKELKELEEPNLMGADGKFFTCEINEVETKGRIRVEDNGVYLCQNEVDGSEYKEKYGYKYSYFIRKGTEDDLKGEDVTDLKLWDYLPNEGDYFYVKSRNQFSYIAIAKNGEYLTNRFVSLDQDDGQLKYNELGFVCLELDIKELRSATTQEITLLDTKLKENGKYFDKESMSIKDIVNEPAFKVGDWVLITKPKDVTQSPFWLNSMDKYDGQTLEIEEINSDGYLVIGGWKFHPDWCTKAEVQKSFKEGDWFIPKKPEDFYNSPVYWDFNMDKFSGKKLKIEAITTSGMLLSNGWHFHPDWCTKVEAPKSNKPKVGDLCILWDNNKSNAIIGKLTSIDKSAFPYGVAFILDYKNCIKFESMEQYNEFIKE